MSDTQAIRDGIIDSMLRMQQSGHFEQIFREDIAPVIAQAMKDEVILQLQTRVKELEEQVKGMTPYLSCADCRLKAKFAVNCGDCKNRSNWQPKETR